MSFQLLKITLQPFANVSPEHSITWEINGPHSLVDALGGLLDGLAKARSHKYIVTCSHGSLNIHYFSPYLHGREIFHNLDKRDGPFYPGSEPIERKP